LPLSFAFNSKAFAKVVKLLLIQLRQNATCRKFSLVISPTQKHNIAFGVSLVVHQVPDSCI